MAIVNKQEIIKRFIEKLRLDPGMERIPMQIADKILPVIDISERGEFKQIFDNSANDSSKSFTVPLGHRWEVEYVHILFIASADVGTRNVVVRILSDGVGSDLLYEGEMEVQPVASGTENCMWSYRCATSDNSLSRYVFQHFPKHVLSGQTIEVIDRQAIANTADDMTVSINFREMSSEA